MNMLIWKIYFERLGPIVQFIYSSKNSCSKKSVTHRKMIQKIIFTDVWNSVTDIGSVHSSEVLVPLSLSVCLSMYLLVVSPLPLVLQPAGAP